MKLGKKAEKKEKGAERDRRGMGKCTIRSPMRPSLNFIRINHGFSMVMWFIHTSLIVAGENHLVKLEIYVMYFVLVLFHLLNQLASMIG